jgi:NNP family nitrate/nitrite transporter-like MFS transporter
MGGLGGFFPPLVLGIIKTQTGHYGLGFLFLSAFCLGCLVLNYLTFLQKKAVAMEADPLRG